ncbi:MAG: hypothetical protein AAF959_22640 [Cyanobacteria bacterium P01_D01_bin.56]
MSNFADAIELRDHLAGLLQSYLGEWENGTPRIHIVPPQQKKAARTTTEATTESEVECIIQRVGTGQVSSLSGPQKYQEPVYKVRLINFGDNTKLSNAIPVIEADSKIIHARPMQYIPGDAQVFEQATLFVRTAKVINTVVYTPT